MFSGSGTNIKMFDFMAAGLPVISTPTGARGINLSGSALHVCAPARIRRRAPSGFSRDRGVRATSRHRRSPAGVRQLCMGAALAASGAAADAASNRAVEPRPAFSVVVPTYERQAHLPKLLDCLASQTCRDFEVILVDQSAAPWEVPDRVLVARHPLRAHGSEGHEPRAQSRRVAGTRRRDRVHRRRLPARTGLAAECDALFRGRPASSAWKGWSSPIGSTTRTTAP